MNAAGWLGGVEIEVFEGPKEYLYGEETALLETIDGRYPFPRIAPPYRRGVEEVVVHHASWIAADPEPINRDETHAFVDAMARMGLDDNAIPEPLPQALSPTLIGLG